MHQSTHGYEENWGRNRKLAFKLHQPMVACGRILLENLWNRGTVMPLHVLNSNQLRHCSQKTYVSY